MGRSIARSNSMFLPVRQLRRYSYWIFLARRKQTEEAVSFVVVWKIADADILEEGNPLFNCGGNFLLNPSQMLRGTSPIIQANLKKIYPPVGKSRRTSFTSLG